MILMRSRLLLPSAAAALVLITSGCSSSGDGSDDQDTAVAAAFYPLAYVAERIAAGTPTDVTALTRPGGEPHDLELDVQTTATISEADLVVFLEDFQPAVDEAVEQNASGKTLNAAEAVDLLAVEESEEEHAEHADERSDEPVGGETEEHADDHTSDETADHADEETADHADEETEEHAEEEQTADTHDHGDEDPHFWHDPLRMADLGDAVAAELAALDEENASSYEENAVDLRADLEALDRAFAEGLADCERDTVVVSHDAFGYLEKYDVHLTGIAGLSPDAEPSPAHLAELQELIREEGITTVFSERLAAPKLSETLANDLGIDTAVLDPIEGLTDDTSGEDYLSLMEQNLTALRTANGCA
jgi:zinc transport system substrate-binding protein